LATSGPAKVSWAKIRLWRGVLLGAFLLLWEMATRRGWVDPFFVSQPTVLAAQIFDWIRSGFILRHLFVTMQETILGFLLGTLLGVAVGFTFARWQTLAHIFDPLMVALNAMPRVVLAPLFILWFGLGLLSKVVMVVSLVFFVVFFSTYTGIREVDRDLVNNARILGANPHHMIRPCCCPRLSPGSSRVCAPASASRSSAPSSVNTSARTRGWGTSSPTRSRCSMPPACWLGCSS
jgi:NitT/TauT family transport system permease protein